jgi:hypothetical protein
LGAVITFGFTLNDAYSGCAGDCFTCHENLKDSKEHMSLKACINCHDPAKNISISATTSDGCGDNCFDCHESWPKDGYHAPLDTCKDCHKGSKSQK